MPRMTTVHLATVAAADLARAASAVSLLPTFPGLTLPVFSFE